MKTTTQQHLNLTLQVYPVNYYSRRPEIEGCPEFNSRWCSPPKGIYLAKVTVQ
jgi:hypothetical protein